jgi:amino acid transporter
VIFNSLFALLGYMGIKAGSGRVFGWFANMTSVAGLMTWFGISFTYLRFYEGLKAQSIDRTTLPFYSKLQPYAAWYAMISCLVVCIFSGWSVFLKGQWAIDTFITNYFPLILFPILYAGAKLFYRKKIKDPLEMDFITNIKEIEAEVLDERPAKNKAEAVWRWLM